MKLASVLATKGPRVVTISNSETLKGAVARLVEFNIGALVVVDAAGKPQGIVSERDIIRRLSQGDEVHALSIDSIMTRDVVYGSPQDDVDAVLATMTSRHFRHLPILDNGVLIGIVSIGDVVKAQLDAYAGHIDTLQTQLMSS